MPAGHPAKVCKVLDLCDGTMDLPIKFTTEKVGDVEHFFGVPPQLNSTDVWIATLQGPRMEAFLTDKTFRLRAAAVLENGSARLITNESAADRFEAELAFFAKRAAEELPPTGGAAKN